MRLATRPGRLLGGVKCIRCISSGTIRLPAANAPRQGAICSLSEGMFISQAPDRVLGHVNRISLPSRVSNLNTRHQANLPYSPESLASRHWAIASMGRPNSSRLRGRRISERRKWCSSKLRPPPVCAGPIDSMNFLTDSIALTVIMNGLPAGIDATVVIDNNESAGRKLRIQV
jgi:hypothetical protein